MPRIALLIEYDGRALHGSQFQVGVRTVQSDLEAAISTYLRREKTTVIFSGRTDAGVHAGGQVAHFDTHDVQPELDLWRFVWAVNGILKSDISVRAAQVVPADFHARFKATSRQYVYRLLNRPQRSALLRDNYCFIPRQLDLERMKAAACYLIGTHDFISFRSSNADKSSTICRVSRAELLNKGEGKLEFWIAADHFVYNMVRIIAGSLIEVGLGKRAPESFASALSSKDRNLAGVTAPSWGLTLASVSYPEEYNLFKAV